MPGECSQQPPRARLPQLEGLVRGAGEGQAAVRIEDGGVAVAGLAALPDDPDGEGLRRLRAGEIDVATFASSSTVRNLVTLLGDDLEPLRRCKIASIGPITASTVEELLGRPPDVVAQEHTIPGLVRALVESYTV